MEKRPLSECGYCIGLDAARVNPLGGAIAMGHPLGATGTRQTVTLLHYMRRLGLHYGVVSMCVGTGMGMAAVFENLEAGDSSSTGSSSSSSSSSSHAHDGDSPSSGGGGASAGAGGGHTAQMGGIALPLSRL